MKEAARIQGNIDGNIFLQYSEKLWKTTNTNKLKLEYNSADQLHASITFSELENC
jgi:hypothetical protein